MVPCVTMLVMCFMLADSAPISLMPLFNYNDLMPAMSLPGQPVKLVLFPGLNYINSDRLNSANLRLNGHSYHGNSQPSSGGGFENQNSDTVVIDNPSYADTRNAEEIMMLQRIEAENRLSLGGIIMAIPWFPIEVNVPDTIAWAYNGIASIIAGIGQRFPRPFKLRPSGMESMEQSQEETQNQIPQLTSKNSALQSQLNWLQPNGNMFMVPPDMVKPMVPMPVVFMPVRIQRFADPIS